jgi:glutaredoxin 3
MKGISEMTSGPPSPERPVTIYTTPHCHWCRVAKHYFAQKNIEYREIDITTNARGKREMVLMTGRHAVPVIRVGEHAMTGWDVREFETLRRGGVKRR